MDALFEAVLWLSVGLLTVLVPIYMLALSHVGPARHVVEGEQALLRTDVTLLKRMIDTATTDTLRRSLQTQLQSYEGDIEKTANLLRWLSLEYSALVPGGFLAASLAVSALARANPGDCQEWLWPIPLLLMACALAVLIRFLYNIEGIVRKSEPECDVKIRAEPSDKVSTGQPCNFRFVVRLTSGDVIRGLQIGLFIPPGWRGFSPTFSFPDDDPLIPNYLAILTPAPWTLKRHIPYSWSFHNIVPPESGTFNLPYLVASEEKTLKRGSIRLEVS